MYLKSLLDYVVENESKFEDEKYGNGLCIMSNGKLIQISGFLCESAVLFEGCELNSEFYLILDLMHSGF